MSKCIFLKRKKQRIFLHHRNMHLMSSTQKTVFSPIRVFTSLYVVEWIDGALFRWNLVVCWAVPCPSFTDLLPIDVHMNTYSHTVMWEDFLGCTVCNIRHHWVGHCIFSSALAFILLKPAVVGICTHPVCACVFFSLQQTHTKKILYLCLRTFMCKLSLCEGWHG